MQFQANLINAEIVQNYESEVTGLGAAFIGLVSRDSVEDIKNLQNKESVCSKANINEINDLYKGWLQ